VRLRITVARLMGLVACVGLAAAIYHRGSATACLAGVVALVGLAAAACSRRLRGVELIVLCTAIWAGLLVLDERGPMWKGSHTMGLDLRVLDSATKRPIPEAVVRLVRLYSPGGVVAEGKTAPDGTARLVGEFTIAGSGTVLRPRVHILYWDRWLEVSAAGHQPFCRFLSEAMGPTGDLHGLPPSTIDVVLEPDDPSVETYFFGGQYIGMTLALHSDGRYTATARVTHSGTSFTKGRYERRGSSLRLIGPFPAEWLGPGQGDWLAVSWGGRRYLLSEGNVGAFEWAVQSGDEPRKTSVGFFFLRGGDWEEAVEGEPELPGRPRADERTKAVP
jgi:hypothetical protein